MDVNLLQTSKDEKTISIITLFKIKYYIYYDGVNN